MHAASTKLLLTLCLAICLSGCGGLKKDFHVAAIESDQHVLNSSPSYVIGTEKASRKRIGGPRHRDCARTDTCFRTDVPSLTAKQKGKIEERFDDVKGHFVTHIVRYDAAKETKDRPTRPNILYSVFSDDGTETCTKCPTDAQKATGGCFDRGWDAVRKLRGDIADTVQREHITHIIVMSTGWNTFQNESIENYNEWINSIRAAADEDHDQGFRPLFIAFSWASDWPRWRPIIKWIDFVNKAHDADEVGLTWANVLIHEVLLPHKQEARTPIILIGHSFGARLLSRAIHSEAILPVPRKGTERVDLFIGLQGAFSLNRFTRNEGREGQPYRDYATAAKKIILTSSEHDDAVSSARHTGDAYVGSAQAYETTQASQYKSIFEHTAINAQGRWSAQPTQDSSKVTMVEASSMVADKSRDGGPHNDVFDKQAGFFIWQAIKTFAPYSPPPPPHP